ncbi:MAG: YceD family protein [Aquiluna sp.]|nr:YceD family protein [Aquiluna sp.]
MTLLVPVHDLMKRPGIMREFNLEHNVVEAMGTTIVKIPAGAELEIFLRLESVHEGVLATGEVSGEAKSECSRCLDSVNLGVEVDFQELFAYSLTSDEDLVVVNEHIDLEQVLIDSIVLNLPFQPVCSETCLGLCPECGIRLEQTIEHGHERPVDPRFSALQDLATKED